MHLDPGVNRLGLNITSVHQTDRRPVTPDIVFPICVILWPQEDGLKQNTAEQKEVNTFHKYILMRTHTHTHTYSTHKHLNMHPGSEKPVLVPCLQESLEKSQSDYKRAKQSMQMKEGEQSLNSQVAFKAGTTLLGRKDLAG